MTPIPFSDKEPTETVDLQYVEAPRKRGYDLIMTLSTWLAIVIIVTLICQAVSGNIW